ncbi:NADH kinase pos5 [Puccinia graminis f. sp. tritici]|uniref:NADH kinase pos5 n=1 Tax=Puccinia graminis f. sp. tritici TaxID=56615 RepID=A0A5B0MWX0_PUCGR|nr:NADH kinase pos5 [Puccinia graminis f. sp. tritici]KAA1092113.1 NADH kinase pos5 [Puccinia graminis f. sp. tritici]
MRLLTTPANNLAGWTRHIFSRNTRRAFTPSTQPAQLTHLSNSHIPPKSISNQTHSPKPQSFSSNSIFNSPINKKIKYPSFKNQRILLVKKSNDQRASNALDSLISYLDQQRPQIKTIVEEDLKTLESRKDIDLVIALGGDGTVLHISHLFKNTACPPILGFNLGTIGFLLPFAPNDWFDVINQVLNGKIGVEERMRLDCFTGQNGSGLQSGDTNAIAQRNLSTSNSLVDLSAMNEVSLHRNDSPHMVAINISIENRFLTQAVADGLIIATPTGSTAYSCSAGGPIVYPSMEAMLLTPICPRSLSFRPLVLPADLHVQLALDPKSRSTAELRVDGIAIKTIQPGESIEIRRSEHPIHIFSPPNSNAFVHDHWINDLNMMLNFNRSYQSKDPR